MSSVKAAIFDVDKTIISIDSMFHFVDYGLRRYPALIYRLPAILWFTFLYKAGIVSVEKVKRAYFKGIERMSEEDLKHFFKTRLQTAIFAEANEEMHKRKREGYIVLLVTASPHAYMKFFQELACVDHVIGTQLVRRPNGGYTSIIDGSNCKGEEKVRRIMEYLKGQNQIIDYDQSCAYSDSTSDMPIMELVAKRYFINRRVPGAEELRWGKNE